MNLIPGKSSVKRPTPMKRFSSLCQLEIRPDSDYFIFRGRPERTGPQVLKGRIVLMNTEPIEIKRISIALEGRWRTSYYVKIRDVEAGLNASPAVLRTGGRHYHDSQELVTSQKKLSPGNYEFPFELELPGNIYESIEGGKIMNPTWLIYQLSASIERKFPHKDLETGKHIRIIRTIDSDAYELLDPLSVGGFWPDKVKYEWSSVSKAIVYGDKVTIDFKLTPLLDKLEIGKVRFWIREIMRIKAVPSPQEFESLGELGSMWREERMLAEQEQDCPEQLEEVLDNELLIPTRKFSLTFDLPKSLRECRQTVEYGDIIQFRHHIHISVALYNPDGHTSELRAHTPIKLYISPHLPIGENNHVTTPAAGFSNISVTGTGPAFPPTYGEHVQDTPINPFQEIGIPSGYITPADLSRGSRSGTSTPRRLGTAEGVPGGQSSSNGHPPLPDELLSRLQTLQGQPEATRQGRRHRSTGSGSNSDDDTEHIEYNMDELGRVPTYNTAVNNPAPATYGQAPPTYATATSRPTSPQLNPPLPAHLRENHQPTS